MPSKHDLLSVRDHGEQVKLFSRSSTTSKAGEHYFIYFIYPHPRSSPKKPSYLHHLSPPPSQPSTTSPRTEQTPQHSPSHKPHPSLTHYTSTSAAKARSWRSPIKSLYINPKDSPPFTPHGHEAFKMTPLHGTLTSPKSRRKGWFIGFRMHSSRASGRTNLPSLRDILQLLQWYNGGLEGGGASEISLRSPSSL